jgi:hypothetical protein
MQKRSCSNPFYASVWMPYTVNKRRKESRVHMNKHCFTLTLSNPIFLPTAYSQALIFFGR